jgi:pSer/pThr/pTyr-binding forkhead associated (FHA) protein
MKVITIGRDESCDIVINNPRVSRVHANIFRQGQAYVYRDSSSNGTRINGLLLRQSDMRISPGDSVLLADTEPLPWHKVQNLLPGGEVEEAYSVSSGQPAVPYGNPTALLIFGYLFALAGGLLGVILGLVLVNSTRTLPGGSKIPKYSPAAITNGWIIFSLSIIFGIVWYIVAANM